MEKLYCTDCLKHTKHIPKMSAVLSGFRVCSNCSRMNKFYTLVKPDDSSFIKQSENIMWVKYNQDGSTKGTTDNIEPGTSLLMSPFNDGFTWLTTITKEIVEENSEFVKFLTENSEYILYKPIKK